VCPPEEKPTKETLFFRKKTAGDLSALPQTVSLPSPDEKYGSFFGRSQRSNPYGRIWGVEAASRRFLEYRISNKELRITKFPNQTISNLKS